MGAFDEAGYAPIRPLLEDGTVSEIMINGLGAVFVERDGRLEYSDCRITSDRELNFLVETILRPTGRRLDAERPYVDGRLPDGSRVNVVASPLAVDGTSVTIRKMARGLANLGDLVANGTLSRGMAKFLQDAIVERKNLVFSGGTGSGKTTLLGLLSQAIDERERLVVIEDTTELSFSQPNVVRLEARRSNVEGSGEVTSEDLLRNALRMRPSRVIMGELRGPDAYEFLQALATGHDGGLAVLHAGTSQGAISRLLSLASASRVQLPLWALKEIIGRELDYVVQVARLTSGQRVVSQISGVFECSENGFRIEDRFRFDAESGKFLEH